MYRHTTNRAYRQCAAEVRHVDAAVLSMRRLGAGLVDFDQALLLLHRQTDTCQRKPCAGAALHSLACGYGEGRTDLDEAGVPGGVVVVEARPQEDVQVRRLDGLPAPVAADGAPVRPCRISSDGLQEDTTVTSADASPVWLLRLEIGLG